MESEPGRPVDVARATAGCGVAIAFHRLRSDDELRDLYQTSGVTPDKDVILHCETGNRASETFLVLKKLGYPRVALYTAGWQEWGNRDDTPVEEA